MARLQVGSAILTATLAWGICANAFGQAAGSTYGTNGEPLLSSKTQRVLSFYGASAQSTAPLRQIPTRPVSGAARPQLPKDKPFTTDSNRPTVSPFLNMFRDDDYDSAPNYYAFVRPQIQAQRFVEKQRFENQRLRRQVQKTSATLGISPAGNANLPTTGHSTRFMSVSRYYQGTR